MLDIKWIRENPEEFDKKIQKRGLDPLSKKILELDEEKRQITTLIQQLQHARREKAKMLSEIRDHSSADFESLRKDAQDIKEKLDELLKKEEQNNELSNLLSNLPNLLAEDVPEGSDESDNLEIKKHGIIRNIANPKSHFDLGENMGMMDFTNTAKMSGSRFVTLKHSLARLERALVNFMIDTHTQKYDFLEISPPYLVKDEAMYGSGQLPKFGDESFKTTTGHRLIPTAEVPLVNYVADSIQKDSDFPKRFVAHTPCFRSEAGAAGKDTRGMIRLHQFSKVELVSITTPSKSNEEHEYILQAAEYILQQLELPYRIMLLCAGDTGFAAKKTYDIEVWLPAQNKYREISSCSNCGDFQARRMKARFRSLSNSGNNKTTEFLHTLNGSGLAVGRTLLSIIENFQNEDGSINIPDKLVSYMGGVKKINKDVLV